MLYLLHFARPYRHARHYLGFCDGRDNLPQRLERHAAGRGSKLMAAVSRAGIDFTVARTWPEGDRHAERRLKNQKHGPRLCPLCRAAAAGKEVRRAA